MSNAVAGFLRPCMVGTLVEDELPCVGRQRAELQSATCTREEGIVLQELDRACIGKCRHRRAHGFNTLDTGFDFNIAGHVMSLPLSRGGALTKMLRRASRLLLQANDVRQRSATAGSLRRSVTMWGL